MKLSVFLMLITVMCIWRGSISEEKDLLGGQRKRRPKDCRFPKEKHGTVRTDGCIQIACTNGKWKYKMRTDICCYKQKVHKPNTVVERIIRADNCSSTTIRCGAVAQLELTHKSCGDPASIQQVEQLEMNLEYQIENLKNTTENHVNELSEMVSRKLETQTTQIENYLDELMKMAKELLEKHTEDTHMVKEGLNMSYQDEKICGEQLQSFLSAGPSSSLTIRCCNPGAKISTCVGLACLEECGGMTCMIPVTDMEDTKDCTEDTYANFLLESVSCGMLVKDNNCPYGYMDSKCACCKFPGYTTNFNCSFDCRCNGICDWLDQRGIDVTYISWCRGCSDNCFDPTDPVSSATPNPIDSYPSLAYYTPPPPPKLDCSKVADDCTLCKQCDYANDCAADCKCNCTCKYITGCTGFNPLEGAQWNRCWRDYAFCCECPVPGQNYAIPCSGMCGGNVNDAPNPNMSYPVPKGIVQSTAFDCNGS